MTDAEIREQFGVDPDSEESLREQLQTKLYLFVKNAEPETLLPPERTLEKVLGISRVTVRNAMLPLYKEGLLVRNTRQGTRIAPRSEGTPPEQHSIHQMALGTDSMDPREKLTLVLYENIPAQQEFWHYTVNSFNSLYPKYHISIHWLPGDVSREHYADYLAKVNPDLFQHELTLDASDLGLKLSDDLRGSFTGKHFLFNGALTFHSLPYACSCAMTYWNQSLAEEYGIPDIRKRLRSGNYLEVLEEADRKLPPRYRIAGHVWDYLAFLGYPPGTPDLKRPFLKKHLEDLARFRGNPRIFYTSQTDSLDAVRNFSNGNQLLVDTNPAAWQTAQANASFKVECEPVHPLPGSRRASPPLLLSVWKKSRYPATAELFMKHLLSEPVQRQLPLRRQLIPARRTAWHYGAQQIFQLPEPAANLLAGQLDAMLPPPAMQFFTYAVWDDLADLLDRNIRLDLVLDQIMLKWEEYQHNNQ